MQIPENSYIDVIILLYILGILFVKGGGGNSKLEHLHSVPES